MSVPSPRVCGLPEKFDQWRPKQEEALHLLQMSTKRVRALCMPTGSGKCLGAGTLVLLFTGEVKAVEEIRVGDVLMGPDSTSRVVVSTTAGQGDLYSVIPVKGTPVVVNRDHVLSLKMTGGVSRSLKKCYSPGSYVNISVTDYLAQSKTFKHCAKAYRVGISFESRPVPLSPYFLGLWLGDGHSRTTGISTADREIVNYLYDLAGDLGLVIRVDKSKSHCPAYYLRAPIRGNRWVSNPILDTLRNLGVSPFKKIPQLYLVNDTPTRYRLLAGLLDSDGSLSRGGFDYISELKELAEGVVFLARSLGLAAYLTPCFKSDQHGARGLYYRVSINGDTDQIPTLISRKQARPRLQKKDVLVTGISVKSMGVGPYWGFTLAGPDSLFVLGDFTVTHNSAVYVADALRSKTPTAIVTDSRALQDQLLGDFGPSGMVDLRGRANYICGLRGDESYTCEHGYNAKCPLKGSVNCPASLAEIQASASYLVCTNYDKWIHTRRFGQGLSHIERVVFDEGHMAPEALARAMQVTLHHKEVEQTLGVNFPLHHEAEFFSHWKLWSQEARARCEHLIQVARGKTQGADPRGVVAKHLTHLRHLNRRLSILGTANPNNWVVEEIKQGYQFDPIAPARYAESAILLQVPNIVIMSATLRQKTLFMTGIGKDSFDYKEFDSDFDAARCPFYYVPTMRVDSRAASLQQLWVRLDQIAGARRDRNGIVHTISYTRRDDILAASRFASSMFVNEKGEPATDMVETFKNQYPGAILVSPSVGQGFDFARKAAEWQMIAKIPFPPPSKILQARTERDSEHPYYLAWQKLAQAAGRLMRGHDDQGETFLFDDHMTWFKGRYGHLAPRSFFQFYREVPNLPRPPERLS